MKGKVTSFPLLLMLAMGILIINCDNSGSGSIFGSLGDKEKAEKRATARSSKQDSNSKEIYTSLYIAGFTYIPEGSFYPAEGFGKMTVSPFYIGKYEITRAEYYNIMGEKPWLLDAYDPYPLSDVYNEEDIERLPCTGMNWFEAVVFCNKLSMKENLLPVYTLPGKGTNPDDWGAIPETYSEEKNIASDDSEKIIQNNPVSLWNRIEADWDADGYRLPTEMEFIWAALGGIETKNRRFSGDNGRNQINDYAWYMINSANNIHPVGRKRSNFPGIFDMTGNVMEWCWDITATVEERSGELTSLDVDDPSLIKNEIVFIILPESEQTDYRGGSLPGQGNTPDSRTIQRAVLGGSWEADEEKSSLAYREESFPESRFPQDRDTKKIGFRVVRK